jgi:hypothetical protein
MLSEHGLGNHNLFGFVQGLGQGLPRMMNEAERVKGKVKELPSQYKFT